MKIITVPLAIIAFIFGSSIRLVACTDPPPVEDKHVINQTPPSPSSSARQTSPRPSWEDKHIVSEHIHQNQRSRSQSPARISIQSHVHEQDRQSPTNRIAQVSHGHHQHHAVAAVETLQSTSDVQNTPIESQTNASPSNSHGSPVHEDIRNRLRSSRRPRSPFENDSSRAERVQRAIRKNKKKQGRTQRRLSR